jgi:hypothetical protein
VVRSDPIAAYEDQATGEDQITFQEELYPMILHIVLFQPRPETTIEQLQTALDHVKTLQQKIPGILDVQTGANLNSTNNKGYTYGFAMQFVDEAHLHAYAPHPDHQVVAKELVSICDSIIDFDIP